jgi:hypothetical protein
VGKVTTPFSTIPAFSHFFIKTFPTPHKRELISFSINSWEMLSKQLSISTSQIHLDEVDLSINVDNLRIASAELRYFLDP